jgi:3-isopropylmalate/(R)-2-methylmalate dehydratase small subunit
MMQLQGRAHRVGDDVDTDVIIPAHLLKGSVVDAKELGKHVMEGMDPDFHARIRQGDIMVAGNNFGCGSSREHAVLALQGSGIACVVAKSFARIFFRNAINQALPVIVCPEAADAIADGDVVQVDLERGVVAVGGKTYAIAPYAPEVRAILEAGGLMNFVRNSAPDRHGSAVTS